MRDPWRSLQLLPWRSLLQVSLLTNLTLIPLELLLHFGYKYSSVFVRVIYFLYTSPVGIITNLALAVGIGALAVYFLERFEKQVRIHTATLWALVPCLMLIIFLKLKLFSPSLLKDLQEEQLMGIVVGVFWKGRPYWRYGW